jgi:SPP1 family predicted phage head-tail adaptor
MKSGKRDKLITIQHRVVTQDTTYGTDVVTWPPFLANIWAEMQDVLPSRAERVAEGISLAKRPCRVRILYYDGITSDMRISYGARYLRIVAGPAELGRREGIELMAEEMSTEGTAP